MQLDFRGSLDRDQFDRLLTLANRPVKNGTMTFDLWIFLVAMGVLMDIGGVISILTNPEMGISLSTIMLLISGVILFAIGIMMKRSTARLWDDTETYRAEREGTVNDDGIEMRSKFSQLRYRWEDFSGYGEYGDVIYLSVKLEGIVFSARFFASSDEWQMFRSIVHEKLPISHEVKNISWPNLIKVFVYLLMIIAIVIILSILRDNGIF